MNALKQFFLLMAWTHTMNPAMKQIRCALPDID